MTHFFNPTYIISVLIAISVHEWAHAITAYKLGDSTAKDAGRLTLNPISHLDPIGALMFLFVGFGWAKPVPVDPMYFRHRKRGMAMTAIMGPVSNLVLALIAFTGIMFVTGGSPGSIDQLLNGSGASSPVQTIALQILGSSLFVNLALMAFNLFPLAPLDGSNVLRLFIPLQFESRYDDLMRIGPFILLFLVIFESYLPFSLLSAWVFGIMQGVLTVFGVLVSLIGL